jgi:hypothetical protein
MAMYRCSGCDELKDNDYDPMDDSELCVECSANKAEAKEQSLEPSPWVRFNGSKREQGE